MHVVVDEDGSAVPRDGVGRALETHLRHVVQPTMQVERTTDALSTALHESSMRRARG